MGKKTETTLVCRGYIGIMENEMEATIICSGHFKGVLGYYTGVI